jgi:RHS repeat-associated protein
VGAKNVENGATYYQYPVYDHRGSVFRIVDENGDIKDSYEYNAWGEVLGEAESGATNRFGWQSNWIRLKEGLYKSPARLYAADAGRFLQRDPPENRSGESAYALATPTSTVDPSGAQANQLTDCMPAGMPPWEFTGGWSFFHGAPTKVQGPVSPQSGVKLGPIIAAIFIWTRPYSDVWSCCRNKKRVIAYGPTKYRCYTDSPPENFPQIQNQVALSISASLQLPLGGSGVEVAEFGIIAAFEGDAELIMKNLVGAKALSPPTPAKPGSVCPGQNENPTLPPGATAASGHANSAR